MQHAVAILHPYLRSNNAVTIPLRAHTQINFANGSVQKLHVVHRLDDDSVQAECLRLVRLGLFMEAENLLEQWCQVN